MHKREQKCPQFSLVVFNGIESKVQCSGLTHFTSIPIIRAFIKAEHLFMSHPHSTIDNHIPWSVCCNTDLFLTFFIFYLSFFGSAQLSHTPEIYINPKAKKNYRPLNVTSVSHPIPDRFVLTSKNIVKFDVTKVKQLKLRNKQKLIFLPKKSRDKFHF